MVMDHSMSYRHVAHTYKRSTQILQGRYSIDKFFFPSQGRVTRQLLPFAFSLNGEMTPDNKFSSIARLYTTNVSIGSYPIT